MSEKLKTITIFATMESELYLDVNVPESADEDEIYDFIRNADIDGDDMKQNLWSGGWEWREDFDMNVDFDPKAKDMSERFLAMMRPSEEEIES